MDRITLALVVAAALASACAGSTRSGVASPSAPPLASAAGKPEKSICRMEKPIGSNIPEMVCRTKEQMDADRQAAQDVLFTLPRSGTGMRP